MRSFSTARAGPCRAGLFGSGWHVAAAVRRDSAGGSELRWHRALDLGLQIELPFESFQINQKVCRSLISLFAVFGERLRDNALQFRGRFSFVARHRRWFLFEDESYDFAGRLSLERNVSRHHLVDDRA